MILADFSFKTFYTSIRRRVSGHTGKNHMEQLKTKNRPNKHKKYRKAQHNKGLVRYELQVNAGAKARFEALVEAAADEFEAPWDIRRRMAKARALVFEEVTSGAIHDFFALKDQIQALKEEIKVLSPSFFISNVPQKAPLPEAIRNLPDDPQQLKTLLSKLYSESQQAKIQATEYKRKADQYLSLYDTVSDYNDELKLKLKENDILISE